MIRYFWVVLGFSVAFLSGIATTYYLLSRDALPDPSLIAKQNPKSETAGHVIPFRKSPDKDDSTRERKSEASPAQAASLPEEREAVADMLRELCLDPTARREKDFSGKNLDAALKEAGSKAGFSDATVVGARPGERVLLEELPGAIGYWRPRTLSNEEIEAWLCHLETWKSGGLNGCIVDIRGWAGGNNFPGAARVVSLFAKAGTMLFSLNGPDVKERIFKAEPQNAEWHEGLPVIVAMNSTTRGAGEALGWALREYARAILIGTPAAGEAGIYEERKLPSGRYFRAATAQLALPDGRILLGTALQPDIVVDFNTSETLTAFQAAYDSGAAPTLREHPSLRRLKDSEEDFLTGDKEANKAPLIRDEVLVRASDIIRAIHVAEMKQPDSPPIEEQKEQNESEEMELELPAQDGNL